MFEMSGIDFAGLDFLQKQNFTPSGYVGAMHGLKRGRDEEGDQPASSKFARREYATDVSSASGIPHILAPGTVLPLWGLSDTDGVLGYITVDDNKIDIGGSAFIVGGKTADGYKVALKVFTTPMHDYQVTLIRRELATVRKLAPHPNIISFLGTCPHQNAILVSPLMCNGNMLRYLERYPATDRHKLVVQVAEALCHVHDVLKLIHGDLKCENVLISDEGDALLADFGLSTAIEKAASDVTTVSDIRQKSTFRFNAPELMLDEVEELDDSGRLRVRSKTMATDIYAFGMLVLQAFTSQRPWPHYRHEMQIISAVCNKRRIHPRPDAQSPAVAAGFTDLHWDICSSCWNFEPQDRPKIRHVLSALVQSTIREDTMSSVQALKYDPTSSRPERNEAIMITSERVAYTSYSGQPASMSESQPRLSPGLMFKVGRQLNGHASQPSEPKNAPGSPKQNGDMDDNGISTHSGPNVPEDLARDASSPDSRSLGNESLNSDHNMSSDPAGSEHSSETEEIDYIADLRRVKVYELADLQWQDRGTAFCTGDFDDNAQEAKIVMKSEANPDQVLLQHTIRGPDVYQRQQETLIVWTETDGTDYALSFQDVEGCAEVWEFIGEVQRHLNGKGEGATSTEEIDFADQQQHGIQQQRRRPATKLVVVENIVQYACENKDAPVNNIPGALVMPAPEPLLFNMGMVNVTAYLADIQIINCVNGQERTLTEFDTLLRSAGWEIERIHSTPGVLLSQIVAVPV